jgi:TonB family protein
MFDVLVSSGSTRRIAPGRGLMAAAVHGILIFGAVRATGGRQTDPPRRELDTMTVIFADPLPVSVPGGAGPGGPTVARPDFELPQVPGEIPIEIPPIQTGPVLDPGHIRKVWSTFGPSNPLSGDSAGPNRILAVEEVDEPAAIVRQPEPRYPPVLQESGLSGRVELEFVIDTTGHVESESIRVLGATRDGFAAAAIESVLHSLFRPARIKGRPVRQLARQLVSFWGRIG